MQFERVSPTQVLVSAPIEAVREAAWHALRNARVPSPLIDVERNIVSGSQGDGVLTVALVTTARFEARPEGTLVSFESRPVLGARDVSAKGREKKLADMLERVIASGYSSNSAHSASAPAPIADPSGAGHQGAILTGVPVYGSLLAPKCGVTLLCYGILSLICCPCIAPLTLIYGMATLKNYEREGDPGDRRLVVAALALAALDCLLMLGLLFLNI